MKLPKCRVCGGPATGFMEHYRQKAMCWWKAVKSLPKSLTHYDCTLDCLGHWERDGEPEWYCPAHRPKTRTGRNKSGIRKAIMGYGCDHCGATLWGHEHEPPPACDCVGARKDRELRRKIRSL